MPGRHRLGTEGRTALRVGQGNSEKLLALDGRIGGGAQEEGLAADVRPENQSAGSGREIQTEACAAGEGRVVDACLGPGRAGPGDGYPDWQALARAVAAGRPLEGARRFVVDDGRGGRAAGAEGGAAREAGQDETERLRPLDQGVR